MPLLLPSRCRVRRRTPHPARESHGECWGPPPPPHLLPAPAPGAGLWRSLPLPRRNRHGPVRTPQHRSHRECQEMHIAPAFILPLAAHGLSRCTPARDLASHPINVRRDAPQVPAALAASWRFRLRRRLSEFLGDGTIGMHTIDVAFVQCPVPAGGRLFKIDEYY